MTFTWRLIHCGCFPEFYKKGGDPHFYLESQVTGTWSALQPLEVSTPQPSGDPTNLGRIEINFVKRGRHLWFQEAIAWKKEYLLFLGLIF